MVVVRMVVPAAALVCMLLASLARAQMTANGIHVIAIDDGPESDSGDTAVAAKGNIRSVLEGRRVGTLVG